MANSVRHCFDIGRTFTIAEFNAVDERAQEYAGGEYPSNADYRSAAMDIIHETQSMLDAIIDAVHLQHPPEESKPTVFDRPPVENISPKGLLENIGEKVIPLAEASENFKRWFRNSQVVDSNGKPKVMYRGTARQDGVVRPGVADAIFLTFNPKFAEDFADQSQQRNAIRAIDENGISPEMDIKDVPLDSYANIQPLFVRAENIWDYEDKKHIDAVMDLLERRGVPNAKDMSGRTLRQRLEQGVWQTIETDKVQDAIRDLGHDSFTVFEKNGEESEKNIAVYDSNQIKSATGNIGTYDDTNPDIRYAKSIQPGSVMEALDMLKSGKINYKLSDAIRRREWADAYAGAKDAVKRKELLKELGNVVTENFVDSLNPVKQWIENSSMSDMLKQRITGDLYRGDTKRSYLQKEVTSQFMSKMYDAIHDAAKAKSMTTDQVKKIAGLWMTARYAQTANMHLITKDRVALNAAIASGDQAAIAEAQKNLNDRLADVHGQVGQVKTRGVAGGFNNAEALQAVTDAEKQIDKQLLEKIAQPVYDMLEWKKQLDIENGKVTQTMVNSWWNDKQYVPLTGDPRYTGEEDQIYASGNQVNQSKEHEMNGRKDSIADDGIDAALTAVLKSINHAGLQDFKRSLNQAYEEAQAAGQDIGVERSHINGMSRTGDNVVMFRDTAVKNGVESTQGYSFKFKDTAVIESLKKANQEHLNSMLKGIGSVTSLYGRLVTQFMPMFAPVNFVRDIWERSEVMRVRKLLDKSGKQVNMDKAARSAIAKSVSPEFLKACSMKNWSKLAPQGSNPVRDNLEELIRLGGMSNYGDYLSRSGSDLEMDIKGKGGVIHQSYDKVKGIMEKWGNTFEMIPSLAIYSALKEQGVEAKDAAAFTLDLMNFRKKGAVMPAIRSLYVFAQPAAQSGYNLAQYLSTRKGKVRFAAQLLIGYGLYAMLRAGWGHEDDDELGEKLDNLSNFTTERTMPIKIGNHMLKVPVGFGPPQLAWMMASTLAKYNSGRYSAGDAIGEAVKGITKSMAPVAASDIELTKRPVAFLAHTFMPSVLSPIINIATNESSLGGKLAPTTLDPKKMKFEQAMRTTPQFYSDVAKEIYNITGVDMLPDHVKAMMDGVLIGPAAQIMDLAVNNEAKKARGEPGKVPVVSQLIDSINDRQRLNSIYYRHSGDLMEASTQYEYLKREDPSQITPELRQQALAYNQFKTADQMIGQQRSALKKMKGKLDEDSYNARLQQIEERADAAHRRVLIRYLQNSR